MRPCRQAINDGSSGAARGSIFSLPEMLFDQNRVTLHHEGSGVAIELSAQEALTAWRQADTGAPLQVSVAKARSGVGAGALSALQRQAGGWGWVRSGREGRLWRATASPKREMMSTRCAITYPLLLGCVWSGQLS